ncbi:MAG: hypothetical protein PARBA_03978 [Parabacteroides sp.]
MAQAGDGWNAIVAGAGNMYQWGRQDYTNHGSSTASGPTSNSKPNNHIFYKAPNHPGDWLTSQNNSLWNGSRKGTNDPCPPGYRVPTIDELKSIGNANSWENGLFKVNADSGYPQLILPAAGGISNQEATSNSQGTQCNCWSSSVPSGSTDASYIFAIDATLKQGAWPRASGLSIRCIRE